jgi:phospholipid/cholesterol/gamma-HCH transport system substrate-binding protein
VTRATVVGVVALVLGALLPACSSGGDTYALTAYFERGISLYPGGDVRVLGLPAGEIIEVEAQATRVRVEMKIRNDVPVPAEVNASIIPLSLIGERYIQLFPAWTTGQERARNGDVIPTERTSIPVEPDEALAALKEFLDTLDPNATGRLVTNLADDLEGNGASLNRAIKGISELTVTLARKDDELAALVDNFDDFTATLVTREQQLAKVLDGFATTAKVLAEERRNVERLVKALAQLSVDGLDLVSEHRARLQRDLDVLARTLDSVRTNIDVVRDLLASAPILVAGDDLDGKNEGLNASYDPQYHRIDLRTSLAPVISDLLDVLGVDGPLVCLPVDVVCPPGASPLPSAPPGTPALPVPGAASTATSSTTSSTAAATTPSAATGALGWIAGVGRRIAGVLP